MEKAVAVKYVKNSQAPFIIAKGKKLLAEKIIEAAGKNGIEIVENSLLAEELFEMDIGAYIPEKYFELMAEILSRVYKMQE
jgi:flagellar biosynthesis protein